MPRDEFPESVKTFVAMEVMLRCSHPGCRRPTFGPTSDPSRLMNVGTAAHVWGPEVCDVITTLRKQTHFLERYVTARMDGNPMALVGTAVLIGSPRYEGTAFDSWMMRLTTLANDWLRLLWNDQWFRKHADSEFLTKRYRADMVRATWIAELVGEWKREYSVETPAVLLSAITRNLSMNDAMLDTHHPLETLAKVLRSKNIEINEGKLRISGEKKEK